MFAGALQNNPGKVDKYDERLINLISDQTGKDARGCQLVSLERPITMGKSVHSRIQSFLGNSQDSYSARRVSTAEYTSTRNKKPMMTKKLHLEETGENTLELRVSEVRAPKTVRDRAQRSMVQRADGMSA